MKFKYKNAIIPTIFLEPNITQTKDFLWVERLNTVKQQK
jgi:hypothetical protein